MVKLPRNADGTTVHWDSKILESWDISESAAQIALEKFTSEGQHLPSLLLCNILMSLLCYIPMPRMHVPLLV